MVCAIVVCFYTLAFLSNLAEFYYASYERYMKNLWACKWKLDPWTWFILTIKSTMLNTFIPLPIILNIQMLSYRELKKSGNQLNTNVNRIRIIRRVGRSFRLVLLVFFSLMTPASVFFPSIHYLDIFKPHIFSSNILLITKLVRVFNLMVTLHSCVNAFIYGKVHRSIRKIYARFQACLCRTVATCCHRETDWKRERKTNLQQAYETELQ